MRAWAAARVAVVILAVLGATPSMAAAQYSLFGLNAEGDVTVGSRFYLIRPSESETTKYEEYRDLPGGLYLDALRLRLARPDESYSFSFAGSKWGQEDAEVGLGVERLGLWQFGAEYDQTPHIYSTNARILATEADPGRWVLPTPRPNLNLHNAAERFDEISQRWDTLRFGFQLTPTPELTFRADYTRIDKNGDRPGGIAFGSPGGNFYEVLAPIDQTIQDLRLRFSVAREMWQIQGGYTFSLFQQGHRGYSADNPCFGLGAAVAAGGCAGDATGAPATGLVSLEPDNHAHTFSLSGGVNLPMRTRLTANVTYSMRMQDESFLPHTINPALAANPALALPQESLDGFVGTTLFNIQATTRPISPLTITARYRLFDFNDDSDVIEFPGHVVSDRTLVVEERFTGRWSYTQQNADIDAKYRIVQPLSFLLGAGWERWDRDDHREVKESDEYFGRVGFDFAPTDRISGRLIYKPAFRRIDDYETFAHLAHTVVEEEVVDAQAQAQSPLLRKYDEADRNRHAFLLTLTYVPTDTVTTTFTGEYRIDDYNNSSLGLQDAKSWSVGVDTSWRPSPRFGLSAGYVFEQIYNKQRSRSRPVTGATTFDFDDFEWITKHTDTVQTAHLGADVAIIPGTLDWSGRFSLMYALGELDTRNPGPVVSGTAAQQTTAAAKRVPAYEDTLVRLDTWLRWYFAKSWTASVGYAWEQFWQNDWRTDGLTPFNPLAGSSIWLGADNRDYSAHLLAVTLGYRFK